VQVALTEAPGHLAPIPFLFDDLRQPLFLLDSEKAVQGGIIEIGIDQEDAALLDRLDQGLGGFALDIVGELGLKDLLTAQLLLPAGFRRHAGPIGRQDLLRITRHHHLRPGNKAVRSRLGLHLFGQLLLHTAGEQKGEQGGDRRGPLARDRAGDGEDAHLAALSGDADIFAQIVKIGEDLFRQRVGKDAGASGLFPGRPGRCGNALFGVNFFQFIKDRTHGTPHRLY